MTNNRTKRPNNSGRPQGRQNAFSGIKLAFLESYKDQFLESTDRGAFYTMVAKLFLEKFGYALPIDGNSTVDDENVDATGEDDPALQTPEEQEQDNERRNKVYRELRDKLGCWFRYRYTSKNTNQAYINNIIQRIMSSSATRPRKKSAMKVYIDVNKTLLNEEFGKRWKGVQGTMQPRDRIGSWSEFVKDRWEKESPALRDEMTKQADEENARNFQEWKQKVAFAGTAEDLDRAWKTSENVLPTLADAMAEWLGANIVILAVAPVGSSDGEVVIRSAQSDTSRGMTKKLISEFDPDGWTKMQKTMLAHGNAYFAPEECRRRVIKNEMSKMDDDTYMDDLKTSIASATATSPPACAAPLPSSWSREQESIPLIQQQPKAATIIPSSTLSPHEHLLPLVEAAAQETPLSVSGLYGFLGDDVNLFASGGQLQHSSSQSSNLWSDHCMPNPSQAGDGSTIDAFPLSLPFQPVSSAAPSQNPPSSLESLSSVTALFSTPISATLSPPLASPSLVTPSLEVPSSVPSQNPSSSLESLSPSLVAPSPEVPSSVPSQNPPSSLESLSPTSVTPSFVAPSLAVPSSAVLSPANVTSEMPSSLIFPPSESPFSEIPPTSSLAMPSSEVPSSNGVPVEPVLTPMAENLVKASLNPDPPSPPNKDNIRTNEAPAPGGNTKKRKATVKPTVARQTRSRVTKDNVMIADTHATQDEGISGKDGAAETAPTRSGRRSNIPKRFEDAGGALPKRNLRPKQKKP